MFKQPGNKASALDFSQEWAALQKASNWECWFIVRFYGLALRTHSLVPCLVLQQGNRNLYEYVMNTDLSVDDLQNISFQILVGLAELHILHFVHRDLKPANVILTGPDNTAKIIDLGSFKNVNLMITGEQLTNGLFTQDYAGPEQLKAALGPTVTTAGAYNMDSWCFGGTLLFMATKELPWFNVPGWSNASLEERLTYLEIHDIASLLDNYQYQLVKLSDKLPPEAMQVLKAAMQWKCADRLSAGQLLELGWFDQLRRELVQQVQQQQEVKEGAPIKQLVDGWVKDGLV